MMRRWGIKRHYAAYLCLGTSQCLLVGCDSLVGDAILVDDSFAQYPSKPNSSSTLTVRHFGVSNLMFDDGETKLLVDGFFSRPSNWKAVLGSRIRPDTEKIDFERNRLNISDVDAILVSHSHFDHAMDVGVRASKYKARIYGSESTKNITLGSIDAKQHDEFVRSVARQAG